jgi:GNAT superfamily N-acetyltransferase
MYFYKEEFDSSILNENVYKMLLIKNEVNIVSKYSYFLNKTKPDIIFAFSDYARRNIDFLQKQNFNFINSRITYKCENLSGSDKVESKKQEKYIITEFSKKTVLDLNKFRKILNNIVASSRYFKDPNIAKEKALTIYQKWLENSFKGYASKIFILKNEETNIPIGFSTLKRENKGLFIDLIGLADEFTGRGLGVNLLNACKNYALSRSEGLFVITEGENIPANRFYQKGGFLLEDFQLVFHKHI